MKREASTAVRSRTPSPRKRGAVPVKEASPESSPEDTDEGLPSAKRRRVSPSSFGTDSNGEDSRRDVGDSKAPDSDSEDLFGDDPEYQHESMSDIALSSQQDPVMSASGLHQRLWPCFYRQKQAMLAALRRPSIPPDCRDEDAAVSNDVALKQLDDLLRGTLSRGEGNSCLLLGPRNSGKSWVSCLNLPHTVD
jgi:origin recognition complex subunit 4